MTLHTIEWHKTGSNGCRMETKSPLSMMVDSSMSLGALAKNIKGSKKIITDVVNERISVLVLIKLDVTAPDIQKSQVIRTVYRMYSLSIRFSEVTPLRHISIVPSFTCLIKLFHSIIDKGQHKFDN